MEGGGRKVSMSQILKGKRYLPDVAGTRFPTISPRETPLGLPESSRRLEGM